MAFNPDYLTINDASELLGCKPHHVLDLVADRRLRCGVFSPGWDGLAWPLDSAYATNEWTFGLVETDGTFLLTNQREGVRFRVKQCSVITFWFLDHGDAIDLATSRDESTEVDYLCPEDGAYWHNNNPQCFPWPEFFFMVFKQQEKSRQIGSADFCFRRTDVEALAALEMTTGTKQEPPNRGGRPREDWKRKLAGEILDAMLKATGLQVGSMSPWPAKNALAIMKNIEKTYRKGAVGVFTITDGTLRDWLPGRFQPGSATAKFDDRLLPNILPKFGENSFTPPQA